MVSKTKIILGVSGLAVLSGTAYYFLKKYTPISKISDEEKLKLFCKRFYSCNQIELFKMQDTFDQLFRERLKDSIDFQEIDEKLEREARENSHGQHKKTCRNNLNNLYYYECIDCSIQQGIATNSSKEQLDGFNYFAFCEDCFDKDFHKDHRFQIKKGKNNVKCDCGSQFLSSFSSYCKIHCGYGKSRQQYQENIEDKKKSSIILFFQELIYLLLTHIRSQIEILEKSRELTTQKIDKTLHNSFFTLILDKMKEIIQHYDPFIYCLKDLLEQPLIRNIPVQPYQLYFNNYSFKQPQTVLDWLFLYLHFSSEANEKYLAEILEEISLSSLEFSLFFTNRFLQNFEMVQKKVQVRIEGKVYNYLNFISSFRITMHPLSREDLLKQIIVKNQEQVLAPIKVLLKYIQEDTEGVSGIYQEDIVTYLIQYLTLFVKNPSLFQLMMPFFSKLVKLVCDICYESSQKLAFVYENGQIQSYSFFENIQSFQIYQQYEIQIIKTVQNLVYSLCILNDDQITLQAINKMVKRYSKGIDKMYNFISTIKNDERQSVFMFGVSFISLIIYIITLSQRKAFSQSVIKKGLQDSFQFPEEPFYLLFICKAQYILRHFFLCFNEVGLSGFLNASNNLHQDMPEIAQNMPIFIERMVSACYGIYDHYILTIQVYNLAETESLLQNSIFFETINFFLSGNKLNRFQNFNFLMYQTLFDQTPFVNIFSGKHQTIFTDYDVNIKEQIDNSIEQIVTDVVIQNSFTGSITFALIEKSVEKFINNLSHYEEQLNNVGILNKQNKQFVISSKNNSLVKTLINSSREFYTLEKRSQFFEYHSCFCNLILADSGDLFKKQLSAQRDLIFHIFLRPELAIQLIKTLLTKPMFIAFPTIQTYLCIIIKHMELFYTQKSEFSSTQQENMEQIIDLFTESTYYNMIIQIFQLALEQPKIDVECYQNQILQQLSNRLTFIMAQQEIIVDKQSYVD